MKEFRTQINADSQDYKKIFSYISVNLRPIK